MQTLFDNQTHGEVLRRIDTLSNHSTPHWGSMNVRQMLKHCQGPLQFANGKLGLDKPNAFMRLVFKLYKSKMYNDDPWKQNIPTVKEFLVTETDSFETEKRMLITEIHDFGNKATNLYWPEHPAFGHFSTSQWGQMQYKHLDHHLRQFGV